MGIGGPDIEGEDAFHQTIGDAITSWQRVEGAAYSLFVAMTTGANPHIVSVIFNHIQSFESRISLLDRCAYFALPDDALKPQWKALKKRLEKNNENRNRIVHFVAGYTNSREFTGYALGPSHMNALYAINDKWKNPDLRIDRPRLRRMRHDFDRLAGDLRTFKDDFAALLARHPAT